MNKRTGLIVGLYGATGYVGQELIRLLIQHAEIDRIELIGRSEIEDFTNTYQHFKNIRKLQVSVKNLNELSNECDLIFVALPHGILSSELTEDILEKCKIIDLGADYRISNVDEYESWYKVAHYSPQLIKKGVYGLSEINREKIRKSRLIANPGCYTTCSLLSLIPLVDKGMIDNQSIIIDAKSGVTGAGRTVNRDILYSETNENIKAYKISAHRHIPEIEDILNSFSANKVIVNFTPHLVPMNRGILTTIYVNPIGNYVESTLRNIYSEYYKGETFVRILSENEHAQTKWVKGSNYFDLQIKLDDRTGRIILVGVIDNLMKGAAGQAIQNMNIMFDFDENTGLTQVPIFPI